MLTNKIISTSLIKENKQLKSLILIFSITQTSYFVTPSILNLLLNDRNMFSLRKHEKMPNKNFTAFSFFLFNCLISCFCVLGFYFFKVVIEVKKA